MKSSLLIISLCVQAALAQTKSDSTWFFETPKFEFPDKPTVGLSYGFTRHSLNGLNESFARPRLTEVKLGFSESKMVDKIARILKRDFHYAALSIVSTDIGGRSAAGEINSKLIRIGLAWDKGYGYELGSSSINSYHVFGLHWSALTVEGGGLSTADSVLLSPFDGTIRFGTKTEGGIRFVIVPMVSVDVGYERAIIMPKHLFLKWAASTILEGISYGMLDRFIDRIMDSSPQVVPVAHLVLKNALSYGLYELRRNRMNWPFDSDPPIVSDSYKVGLTFVF